MSKYKILAVFNVEGKKIKSDTDAYNQLMEWIEDWQSDELKKALTIKTITEQR